MRDKIEAKKRPVIINAMCTQAHGKSTLLFIWLFFTMNFNSLNHQRAQMLKPTPAKYISSKICGVPKRYDSYFRLGFFFFIHVNHMFWIMENWVTELTGLVALFLFRQWVLRWMEISRVSMEDGSIIIMASHRIKRRQ